MCGSTGKPLDGEIHQRVAHARVVRSSPLIGVVLDGRYKILRTIGSGGMGTVFEAENLPLRRLVAVKVVSRPDSQDALDRFAREASIISSVQHANICAVYDVGELPGGGPYIVLERLVGDTLAARMGRQRMPVREILDVFVQILSGLHAAHSAQILHRDLKPQNVFLVKRSGGNPLVKIVDFGLARDLSASASKRLTKPGRLCGTLQYMSPEQLRGEQLDQRSDVFSLGVLLYEVLTGHHPFAASSVLELQTNILRLDAPPVGRLRPDIPRSLQEMVSWAMMRSPAQRPASALDLQRGLLAVSAAAIPSLDDDDTTTEAEPISITNPVWIPPTSSPSA